jgi:hypothetical protein
MCLMLMIKFMLNNSFKLQRSFCLFLHTFFIWNNKILHFIDVLTHSSHYFLHFYSSFPIKFHHDKLLLNALEPVRFDNFIE